MISVVIPTKNRPDFLKKAISSFKKMDIEIIIIDDASDGIFRKKNEQIANNLKYVFLTSSKGPAKARNIGLDLANGNYVWFFDDDDFVYPQTIKEVKKFLANNKSIDILFLPKIVLFRDKIIKTVYPLKTKCNYSYIRNFGHPVNTSCSIFSKKILKKIGGWDSKLLSGQDTDLFLRASKVGKISCIKTKPVEIIVGHPGRITANVLKQQIGKIQFLKKHWFNLTLRRKFYYIITFLLWVPLIRNFKFYMRSKNKEGKK